MGEAGERNKGSSKAKCGEGEGAKKGERERQRESKGVWRRWSTL